MAHSNQVREFLLTSSGVELVEPYIGPELVLTGTARATQESKDRAVAAAKKAEAERFALLRKRRRAAFERQIAALEAEFAADEAELDRVASAADDVGAALDADRKRMEVLRGTSPQNGAGSTRPSGSARRAPNKTTGARGA
jgi:circadian clock protein KaiC